MSFVTALLAVAGLVAATRLDFHLMEVPVTRKALGLWAAAGAVGAFGVILAAHFGTADLASAWPYIVLGAAFLIAAVVDRNTGYAPNLLVFAMGVLSPVIGAMEGVWDISYAWAAAVGLSFVVTANLFWITLGFMTKRYDWTPPGDMVAIAVPFMIWGASFSSVFAMMGTAVLGYGCLHSKRVADFFTAPSVRKEIAAERNWSAERADQGAAILTLIMPVCWLIMITNLVGV